MVYFRLTRARIRLHEFRQHADPRLRVLARRVQKVLQLGAPDLQVPPGNVEQGQEQLQLHLRLEVLEKEIKELVQKYGTNLGRDGAFDAEGESNDATCFPDNARSGD